MLTGQAPMVIALDLLREYLRRQGACHIAGLGAAHAVAHHEQRGVFIQLMDLVSILILGPDTARVRQCPMLHGFRSPRNIN